MTISVATLTARVAAMALICAAGWPTRIWSVVPTDSGVPEFRAVTTNLDGSGITMAQPEASLTMDLLTWEVNPANTAQTNPLLTYTTFNGATNEFPNALGFDSGHADAVGDILYGATDGIAPGVARVDNFEADFFYENYLCNTNLPGLGDAVVNQSFTFGTLAVADQEMVDSEYDNYAEQNQTLFISAANNLGNSPVVCAPGTAYNCISVGAYVNGTYANSPGPTRDNARCKPDLTAVGTETSFSTPLVAGAAAVLLQAALRGDGGAATNDAADLRTIKALLLNGAVKTPDWTNSCTSPLDARYGAGVLNLLNAYEELIGGEHHFVSSCETPLGGPHPPECPPGCIGTLSGWDFNTNISDAASDTVNHYYFRTGPGSTRAPLAVTATLVWNRQLNQSNINHLSLFLYDCDHSNVVAGSASLVDNVQHLHVPRLMPGCYDLQVWKAGGLPGSNVVSAAETYSLAWAWVSPSLTMIPCGRSVMLSWPLYPAGFAVESNTNFYSPNWTTNQLPAPIITNGENFLKLNCSGPGQLFRLSSH